MKITERYSHSACYHNKSVYIFGGCTLSNTTFNDLWRFDLATRKWIRPVALGGYIMYIFDYGSVVSPQVNMLNIIDILSLSHLNNISCKFIDISCSNM